jgi:hypothetical protein
MNRVSAVSLVILIMFGVLGLSWRSSAKMALESGHYRFQETRTPSPTPTPSPSPSPGVTPTPVPEPEPAPSGTATPINLLTILNRK